MAKLPSVVTSDLTGSAISYYGGKNNTTNVWFKQEFQVTKNSNFTWTVTSKLYIKLPTTYTEGGQAFEGLWQRIQDNEFRLSQRVDITVNGVYVNGSQVSSNAYQYTKVMENTETIGVSVSGRLGQRLDCGYTYNSTSYYCDDYTLIYLTLPAFSGMRLKNPVTGGWRYCMPWVKVNGTWKMAEQYIKINGTWKKYNDTWVYNPDA